MSKLSSALKKGCAVIGIITVFLVTALPCFAVDAPIQSSNVNYTLYTDPSDNNQMLCSISWVACRPYFIDTNYAFETNQGQEGAATVAQDFIILIRYTNRTNKNLFCNYNSCTINFPLQRVDTSITAFQYGSSYSEFSGNLFSGFRLNSNGNTFTFSWHPDFQYGLGIVVPAKQTLYCYFVYTQYSNPDFSNQPYMWDDPSLFAMQVISSQVSIGYPTASQVNPINIFSVSDVGYNTIIQNSKIEQLYQELVTTHTTLNNINSNVQYIINQYESQSSTATNITSSANAVTSDVDYVHQQEESFYIANEDALSDAGLANFDFDNSTKLGYQSINEEFNRLWTALGRWNFIYVFTLLMSLVAYILRHRPWTTLGTHKDN